ncbi:glycosyltransferase family 2 protein [Pseudidiomarina andamanensis]|uniref:Glycosyltransferase family 2 protein n=1 Tax=Pseudidiomarina andamanensis TaxID=1940690 RepID=A0AA92INB4_9GAMM|nr:glycosyltransferase family 2 protein [Pseudidiomarina andamanensis]MDS0217749.1 glycosyltransferase [Pseudidiomarina andamanensis]QGT96737.1 glycosyltransferase family 2 protein [Pseudidiomarina andamanensis]
MSKSESKDVDIKCVDTPKLITDQYWITNDAPPLVTISCTTFNQKHFIGKCIESFLSQKTTFKIEILIYDDASDDGTSEIVRQYQERFPTLIKTFIQEENQFSQGRNVNIANFSSAQGKFIALCHGDDYWCSADKLQSQVEAMNKFDVDISGHAAIKVDVNDRILDGLTGYQVNKVKYFSFRSLIENNGNMLPFGSIMITEKAKSRMLEYMPPVTFHTGIQMLGALDKGLIVLPDVLSAYRIDVPGSTTEILLKDIKRVENTTLRRVTSFKFLRKLSNRSYMSAFNKLLAKQVLQGKQLRISSRLIVLRAVLENESIASRVEIIILLVAHSFKKIARLIVR